MKLLRFLMILPLISGGLAFAADTPKVQEDIEVEMVAPMAPGGMPHHFMFITADMEDAGKTVKGAPYSAEAITERSQTLSDGNRIVNKSTAKVYRDSEGRTRREQQMAAIGNWKSAEEAPKIVFIQDPVAKVHYVLEPDNQTARKMAIDDAKHAPLAPKGEKFEVQIETPPMPHGSSWTQATQYRIHEKDSKTESLGKQTMEGLPVDGTRTTITIPAGEMGNELPIQIVSERWYSPDLQTNIMTRHSDPRFGETVYQLTRISRTEQDRSLFEVPNNYKVEKGPPQNKIIHRKVTKD